jgi:hypothetical protein
MVGVGTGFGAALVDGDQYEVMPHGPVCIGLWQLRCASWRAIRAKDLARTASRALPSRTQGFLRDDPALRRNFSGHGIAVSGPVPGFFRTIVSACPGCVHARFSCGFRWAAAPMHRVAGALKLPQFQSRDPCDAAN